MVVRGGKDKLQNASRSCTHCYNKTDNQLKTYCTAHGNCSRKGVPLDEAREGLGDNGYMKVRTESLHHS